MEACGCQLAYERPAMRASVHACMHVKEPLAIALFSQVGNGSRQPASFAGTVMMRVIGDFHKLSLPVLGSRTSRHNEPIPCL